MTLNMVGFRNSGIPATIATDTICRRHYDKLPNLFKPAGFVNSEIDQERRSILLTGGRMMDRRIEKSVRACPEPHRGTIFNVPGVSREQLSIGIEGNVIRIETLPEAKRQYKAAYELPQDIDVSKSETRLENGVLTLKLVKVLPENKAVKLAIN
jgi:hypothetical protein